MFNLTDEQRSKYQEWLKEHDKECLYTNPEAQGAIGGRITYCFTPTGLGVITSIRCACGGSIDLTDYENW